MDAQDVSLIILADRSKLIDRMANTAENWFTTAPEYRTKANLVKAIRMAGKDMK
jgi:3-phenylpropionate/cinnamic acid dioxygenase small subunit